MDFDLLRDFAVALFIGVLVGMFGDEVLPD